MASDQWLLLKTQRFLPLFLTQFLGAFNDNIFKNALVILITYTAVDNASISPQIMITIAAGLFILPFFLFSAVAGQFADKYDKARLIQIIKAVEIALMIGAAIGFLTDSTGFLLLVLFLMGTQSAFFGPVKYGILPDQLQQNELIAGNALVEAGTFVSILLGTILGGLLIMTTHGGVIISILIIAVAAAGWYSSLSIPATKPAAPELVIQTQIWAETQSILQYIHGHKVIFRAILGISWFWLFGATFLSQFPTFGKDVIGGNEQVVTLFLAVFSIGIGVGSLLCNKLLKGDIQTTYVPLGILGMSIFTIDLYFASSQLVPQVNEGLIGVATYLNTFTHWRILFDLLGISICGGIYIVPLYALIQDHAEISHRSRVIAGNNIMNALFMFVSAVIISIFLAMNFTVTTIFLIIALLNTLVVVYIVALLPEALIKSILQSLFHTFYRLSVNGSEHYRQLSDKSIIIANHLSLLDAALIAVAVPERVSFAINTHMAERWWVKPFLVFVDTIPLDPTNPMSTRMLIERVNKGEKIVIFPEGRLTVTGSLMKIYEGPAMIADKTGAQLLPVIISGAQYTPFSRLRGKVRIRLFPKITLTMMPPIQFNVPEDIKGKERRHKAGLQLYDIMSNMMFQSNNREQTLFQSLLDAMRIHGRRHLIAEDVERKPLSYQQLIMRCFILGRLLRRHTPQQAHVGILLPNMVVTLICFFALQVFGRIPAMLNFSTSKNNLLSACKIAQIKQVITSHKFVTAGKLTDLVAALEADQIKVLYLEDLAPEVSVWDKLRGFCMAWVPQLYYSHINPQRHPDLTAVILFTSGSEGVPKGVVLSHTNIQANRFQVSSRIDFGPTDIVFNALPVFHSFGLTGGTILPLLSGIRIFFYPSPLHYRIVPELVYDTNATLLFGTDTFLTGYARFAHPYDFHSIRYVFAGAEKLRDSTRRKWSELFGARIFEGYGATETAPILSMNTPMHNQPGSVGRLMPGITYQLEPVTGIDQGGRLLVSGPNIMQGYYKIDQPGTVVPPENGWYDTGDIVDIDGLGYVTIKGRAKRFAKIAGEMVSLTAVEESISKLWPEYQHAILAVPDERKGEQLILVTTNPAANRDAVQQYIQENDIGALSLPKTVLIIEKMPVLGTGKTNYVELQAWITGKY